MKVNGVQNNIGGENEETKRTKYLFFLSQSQKSLKIL